MRLSAHVDPGAVIDLFERIEQVDALIDEIYEELGSERPAPRRPEPRPRPVAPPSAALPVVAQGAVYAAAGLAAQLPVAAAAFGVTTGAALALTLLSS